MRFNSGFKGLSQHGIVNENLGVISNSARVSGQDRAQSVCPNPATHCKQGWISPTNDSHTMTKGEIGRCFGGQRT